MDGTSDAMMHFVCAYWRTPEKINQGSPVFSLMSRVSSDHVQDETFHESREIQGPGMILRQVLAQNITIATEGHQVVFANHPWEVRKGTGNPLRDIIPPLKYHSSQCSHPFRVL